MSQAQESQITVESTDGVVQITLNQPRRRNALSQQMWRDLTAAIDAITSAHQQQPNAVRAVVIQGAGSAFCAGADISEFERVYATPASASAASANIEAALQRVEQLPMPSIAAIRGPCMGGGCALALACDIQLADSSARFGINPTALGTAYSYNDSRRLIGRVGITRAKLMLIGAQVVDAPTALDWGLVGALHEAEELDNEVGKLTTAISARSPNAMRATKRIISAIDTAQNAPDDMQQLFEDCFSSADFEEGVAAFLAKRTAAF